MLKMISRQFIFILLLFCVQPVFAGLETQLFDDAKNAFEKKDVAKLRQLSRQLDNQHDLLAPYAKYWLLNLDIDNASDQEIKTFLNAHQDYAFADNLQASWLKKLGEARQWQTFFDAHANYQGSDAGVACLFEYGKTQTGQQPDVAAIRGLWLHNKQRPQACNVLFDSMINQGVITTENRFQRMRLALQANQRGLAKSIATQFRYIDHKTARLIDRAKSSPKTFLTKRIASFKSPFGVELNLYALNRLAIADVNSAVSVLRQVQGSFKPDDRAVAWQIVAYRAAKSLHPNALDYYRLAKNAPPIPHYLQAEAWYEDQYDWKARAALRVEDWKALLYAIAEMPTIQGEHARWRYWKARALMALDGAPSTESIALLKDLSHERHYYGWLAADELGISVHEGYQKTTQVNPTDIQTIADMPQVQRAVALQQFDLRYEARKEWYAATKGLDDRSLLAASIYAQKLGWYDLSINTADNTKQQHNFDLRYPNPYNHYFSQAAAEENLDKAWLFGLVRQESRFMDYAKSVVGATGLMQLMPKTASWIAKKKGMRGFTRQSIRDVKTNIALGTFYMRHTLDMMQGKAVMATAAYNAGPSRAFKWQANRPLEGAIYIESIPFNETRNYVQRVMANAHIYAPKIGAEVQTLKQRIGTIPAKSE